MTRQIKWLGRVLAAAWLTVLLGLAGALPAHATMFLASEDSSDSGSLGLFLLALGPAVYFAIYAFYRNPDARHKYETETDVKIDNLEASDHQVESRKKTTHSVLPGANSTKLWGNPLNKRS